MFQGSQGHHFFFFNPSFTEYLRQASGTYITPLSLNFCVSEVLLYKALRAVLYIAEAHQMLPMTIETLYHPLAN